MRHLLLRITALLVLTLAGCPGRTPTTAYKPPPIRPSRAALDPGDVLNISVFGEKALSGKFQISSSGTIDFPLVGTLRVVGMQPPEVAALIRRRLAGGYIKKPDVSVLAEGFSDKQRIHVWGQVRKSGTFRYTPNMTIIEALTLAGGLSPLANRNGITLTRIENGRKRRYRVPMDDGQGSSYRLRPGDVVFVSERVF